MRYVHTGRRDRSSSHISDIQFLPMFLWSLVIAQFVLSAAIVLSADWSPVPIWALLASAPGVLLAVTAWWAVGLSKIRIHPETTNATELKTDGPYGLVRHPMYSGLLWFTAALLGEPFVTWRLACWVFLLVVLYIKSRYEEISLVDRFPEYRSYQSRVGGLLPRFRRNDISSPGG